MSSINEICIVNRNKETKNIQLDMNLPLSEWIQISCSEFAIKNTSEYGLLCEDAKNDLTYLTDNNLQMIEINKLFLDYEPNKLFTETLHLINTSVDLVENFNKLYHLLNDEIFIEVFIQNDGPKFLNSQFLLPSNERMKPVIISCFVKLCESNKLTNDCVSDEFFEEVFLQLGELLTPNTYSAELYLVLAYFIRNNYPELYDFASNKTQLSTLVQSVISESELVHVATLDFINTVFNFTDPDQQTSLANVILEHNELRLFTFKYILKKGREYSPKLVRQIIDLQNMLNFVEKKTYTTPVVLTEQNVMELLKLIQKYDQQRDYKEIVTNLGFKSPTSLKDELQNLPNKLVFDCFTYFITKNENCAYYPEIGPPLIRLITVATTELIKCLQMESEVGQQTNYTPLLFEKPFGFKEIVSKIIKSHKNILSQYSTHESCKVLSHFITRIRKSFSKACYDLNQYQIRLEKLSKDYLDSIMTETNNQWSERVKNLPPVNRLRSFYSPQVEQLLKKQAFNRMAEGITVEVIVAQKSKKSVREDSVKFCLNNSFTGFEYLTEGTQHNLIPITDIAKVYFGESAISKVDEKLIKKVAISSLAVFETKSSEKFAFAIEPEFHQLITDVIGFVENKKIDATWEPQSYKELLSCIIDVALMDLNEADIPSEPPIVPDLPQNFEFTMPK